MDPQEVGRWQRGPCYRAGPGPGLGRGLVEMPGFSKLLDHSC